MKRLIPMVVFTLLGAVNLYAMGTPPAGAPQNGKGGGGLLTILPLIFILVIFYFLILFPQRQTQKKQIEMIKNLKNGDKVITSCGIHGTITKTDKDTVSLQISSSPKAELIIEKSAISRVLP